MFVTLHPHSTKFFLKILQKILNGTSDVLNGIFNHLGRQKYHSGFADL